MALADEETPSDAYWRLRETLRPRFSANDDGNPIWVYLVEGQTDTHPYAAAFRASPDDFFVAGNRRKVENVLVEFLRDSSRRPDLQCIGITDCDGKGKVQSAILRDEKRLVVTQFCDLEADLVGLGAVADWVREHLALPGDELVARAVGASLPLSTVRRRASRLRNPEVGFRYPGQGTNRERLGFNDIAVEVTTGWLEEPPSEDEVVAAVGFELGWDAEAKSRVLAEPLDVSPTFENVGSGKDVLGALDLLIRETLGREGATPEWRDHRGFMNALLAQGARMRERDWDVLKRVDAVRAAEASPS